MFIESNFHHHNLVLLYGNAGHSLKSMPCLYCPIDNRSLPENRDNRYVVIVSDTGSAGSSTARTQQLKLLNIAIHDPQALIIMENTSEPLSIIEAHALFSNITDQQILDDRVIIAVSDAVYLNSWKKLAALYGLELKNTVIYSQNNLGDKCFKHKIPQEKNIKFRTGIYSRNFKPFRLWIYYRLFQEGLLDQMQASFYNINGYGDLAIFNEEQFIERALDAEYSLEYIPIKFSDYDISTGLKEFYKMLPLKINPADGYDANFPRDILDVGVHCVIETVPVNVGNTEQSLTKTDRGFITEKTYRPIHLKQPFLLIGPENSYDFLHELGFKTFGDFWDEESIDTGDFYDRIESFINILKYIHSLSDKEFHDMLEKMKPILEHNYNLRIELEEKQHRDNEKIQQLIIKWLKEDTQ